MKKTSAFVAPQEKLNIQLPSPLMPLVVGTSRCHLWIKRDDLIHPIISGNKWRKLQQLLSNWPNEGYKQLLSFGGGYSNHLHALGYACHQLNIPLTAMIRGNYETRLTPMLQDLLQWGTRLHWLSKKDYQQKNNPDWLRQQPLIDQHTLVIPEGGSSEQVHAGMQQLVAELPEELDYLLCPVGSGGTLAGIIQAMWQAQRHTKVIGIAVLKGEDYLEGLVQSLVTEPACLTEVDWQILHQFHGGGYAKCPVELHQFMQTFQQTTGLVTEPVYSGKLFFALRTLLTQDYLPEGSRICAVHTGGLQGKRQKD